jgi:SAM-dependent methyltransferase
MHPVNEFLSHFGVRLSRMRGVIRPPSAFMEAYRRNLAILNRDPRGFQVFKELQYDAGTHPEGYIDFECTFAAQQIGMLNPQSILDIGSYRHFVLGLLSHFDVTTVDVRGRRPISGKETVITCDAKQLSLPDESYDVVLSLSTLEHFGLGRYGDEFDLDGDKKALREMVRILKSGGHLIFTTTLTKSQPSIGFNAHRIYSREMLRERCEGLVCMEEEFYSMTSQDTCSFEQITENAESWDVYCGRWRKP